MSADPQLLPISRKADLLIDDGLRRVTVVMVPPMLGGMRIQENLKNA